MKTPPKNISAMLTVMAAIAPNGPVIGPYLREPRPARIPGEADHARMAAAAQKRQRRAARNRKNMESTA